MCIYIYIYRSCILPCSIRTVRVLHWQSTICHHHPGLFRLIQITSWYIYGGFYFVRVMTFHSEFFFAKWYKFGCNFCFAP